MKINKNSALYKIGVIVFIVLAIIYSVCTMDEDKNDFTGSSPNTEVSANESETGAKDDSGDTKYDLLFRNDELLQQHYEKHGIDMGFKSAAEYAKAANKVLENEDTLHKVEAEDGDDVYYLEKTNEFVVVSKDGYIRTYFNPDDGIDYFNRQ